MAKRTETPAKSRRRPVQPRSHETSRAIRDAFVRLLDEKPFSAVTIREIVLVAGVGLGTFYEYFSSKDELARACVHLRTKDLLLAMRRRRTALGSYDIATGVTAAITAQAEIYAQAPREWMQHFMLERHKSERSHYLEAYDLFLKEWEALLEGAADWPPGRSARDAARPVFTLLYGMFAHALIRGMPPADFTVYRDELVRAALGCVAAMMPPQTNAGATEPSGGRRA
ncbi:TetR/AcrR family transcriptional regulator [Rhodopseudomonas palustris]|uniref:TetR/AcrR family transcriptional regulator n=1 Tax=Rhodopseudomonas palustris TaxID=1076 RepID=A0A323UFS4_RHOPL|nr:TetR/AcrR family transcriptional regulator [Rhodopseudomonas palustris]PZA11189.1 TetR/AcrR family transcriptional regulator [Rhodopseudomonas palustris]